MKLIKKNKENTSSQSTVFTSVLGSGPSWSACVTTTFFLASIPEREINCFKSERKHIRGLSEVWCMACKMTSSPKINTTQADLGRFHLLVSMICNSPCFPPHQRIRNPSSLSKLKFQNFWLLRAFLVIALWRVTFCSLKTKVQQNKATLRSSRRLSRCL